MASDQNKRKLAPSWRANPEPKSYRDGGEGMVQWCHDYVHMPVYEPGSDVASWVPFSDLPKIKHNETGRSYQDMWDNQSNVLKQALVMDEEGRLKHRLIIFCWPRGEGKSAIAVLIQLWKFFNFPRQQIVLGANSKEQTKFVHFDIMRDIIRNSPKLYRGIGPANVQEKEIRMRVPGTKENLSVIKSISSFSGIVSNITGYTFSEMFDMKNPKFFTQLDGSIRNMPNALGVIDSTVSAKTHILHHMYNTYRAGKDPYLYFHYRMSRDAIFTDYWHPHNTQKQLDSYRSKFIGVEFDRYFKNLWESGSNRVFSDEQIEAFKYIGVDNMVGGGPVIMDLLRKKHKAKKKIEDNIQMGFLDNSGHQLTMHEVDARLWGIESVYQLVDAAGYPRMATLSDLDGLGQIFNTDWTITVGVDRADPIKTGPGANTIITVLAKGLPNSKTHPPNPHDLTVPPYIYILMHLKNVQSSELDDIKFELLRINDEFEIDAMASERWGMFDLVPWCEEHQIPFEPVNPSYDRQREVFSELYSIVATGRFKTPALGERGRKENDILIEESKMFDSDPNAKWYGSPEKNAQNGVQDDSIYSLAYAVYAGRALTFQDFHARAGKLAFWGTFVPNPDLVQR